MSDAHRLAPEVQHSFPTKAWHGGTRREVSERSLHHSHEDPRSTHHAGVGTRSGSPRREQREAAQQPRAPLLRDTPRMSDAGNARRSAVVFGARNFGRGVI